jgi:hypothetical protein
MAAEQGRPPWPGANRPEAQAQPARRRQPVYIICSPRSRVGRSVLARLLTEYVLSDGRRALAFDVNPEDRALARHLPLHALPGSIADTRGQMALFDRLIVNDGSVKVVDVAGDQFQQFFDVIYQIGFLAEARARGLDVILLFVVGDDRKSDAAYRRLLIRREQFTVVPVENPGVAAPPAPTAPPLPHASPPLIVPVLPPTLRSVAERPDFSFADCIRRPSEYPLALAEWVGRMFLAFRDLELRLQIADFAALLQR